MRPRTTIVAGEPLLRVLHQVFLLSGCRDSRGHLNSIVRPLREANPVSDSNVVIFVTKNRGGWC